jgi:hypothetical protein
MTELRERKAASSQLPALGGAGLSGILLAEEAAAQTLGGGASVDIPFVRILAALILAILIALGAALVLKRQAGGGLGLSRLFGRQVAGGRTAKRIKVHETHRLSPHADLCRFTAAHREYLIVVSPHTTHVLAVSEEEQPDKVETVGRTSS